MRHAAYGMVDGGMVDGGRETGNGEWGTGNGRGFDVVTVTVTCSHLSQLGHVRSARHGSDSAWKSPQLSARGGEGSTTTQHLQVLLHLSAAGSSHDMLIATSEETGVQHGRS